MTVAVAVRREWPMLLGLAAVLAWVYGAVVWRMALHWSEDPNYSHGFIVPLVSAYFLYTRRRDLAEAEIAPAASRASLAALAPLSLIAAGLVLLVLGSLMAELFTMRFSLIVVLTGLVWSLFGTKTLRLSAFPLAYLALMVPIPYIVYDSLSFPLKLFVARWSVGALKLAGLPVLREGNIILFPGLSLEVADACSGLRSLTSLFALVIAFAAFSKLDNARRVILVLTTIPIAVAANGLRVIATGMLAHYSGVWAAEGFFHEFAGLSVFLLAIAMTMGVAALLKPGRKEEGS
jgi:exosortase